MLNVALAGAGMISRHHLIAWRNVAPAARVVGVYDPDAGRARSRAAEFGIDAVFTDGAALLDEAEVGALDVAAPRAEHAGWVEAAAARGIDVLCQKPLTPTLAEGEALLGRLAGQRPPHGARELALPALVPDARALDRRGRARRAAARRR